MPLPSSSTIVSGLNASTGCAYWREKNLLLLVDSGLGTIIGVNVQTHARTVLGSGYMGLKDIALSVDGSSAYVSEQGNLLRVPLSNLDRAAATILTSGLGGRFQGQIGLDEAHGYAYSTGGTSIIELYRINLSTGARSTVVSGLLAKVRGLLASRDGRFVYASTDDDYIIRYNLSDATTKVVANGLADPRHMSWLDAGESIIVFVQHATRMVMKLDLTTPTPVVSPLAGPTDASPYSLALPAADHVLVTCLSFVDEIRLSSSIYSASGPIYLGVGFVPADVTHQP